MNQLVARLVVWSQTFSIRVKIMGLAVAMVLLMGLSASLLAQSAFVDATGAELERRGGSIAADVAARGVDMLLTHNVLGLHELLAATLANNDDVRYVVLLDRKGRVAAHTFGHAFPRDLLTLPLPGPQERQKVQLLMTEEGILHDVALPILEGTAGTVRVGMSQERLQQQALEMTRRLGMAVLFTAMVALLSAYFLTLMLTRPVIDLTDVAQGVALGRLSRRAPPGPPDELGLLIGAFNTMLDRLEESQRVKDHLLDRVISAQEDERRRIARELHDETSQAITSMIVSIRALAEEHPAIRAQAADLRVLAAGTLDEIHGLIMELRPRVLDEMGLVPALRQYVNDFGSKHGIHVEFEALGTDLRLPARVESCLYRVVQEALTNVARHAQAANASVVLDIRPDQVSAIVEDDGAGFDPDRESGPRSLGLAGMRERVALLEGTLQVESGPDLGTSIFAKVPLKGEGDIAAADFADR